MSNADEGPIRRAQEGFIANLLEVSADRLGFAGPATGPEVNANVERRGTAGLALVGIDGGLIAASKAMPALDETMISFLSRAARGRVAIRDIFAKAGQEMELEGAGVTGGNRARASQKYKVAPER